ncbi:MAG: 1,4-alpha-glucan branching protein GlgB [Rhodothermia bacterium]|nr:MAG: 1,4-alpha-glucan branching protein GlgB [Rhodothermia bacterium]
MALLSKTDLRTWKSGNWFDCYGKLGAHPTESGTSFCVWAPGVDRVSVIGDFNDWDAHANPLKKTGRGKATFWEGEIQSAEPGHRYKYRIETRKTKVVKADPFGFSMEPPQPGGSGIRGLSSIITDLSYNWQDDAWLSKKEQYQAPHPVSIYEVHLGSWRRAEDGTHQSYHDLAESLIEYVLEMGFTHVEFLPLLEHPFYASWGYQAVGYYAPTERYGSPANFKELIDRLHRAGIGVYLDWVPAHFATDPQGLEYFTGKPLFEYDDPLMQVHPDWGTHVFDFEKPGVRNFLIANAFFWLDEYHIDGLRVDAVASMLYRDYSREKWSRNKEGGRVNLEACQLLKDINDAVKARFSGAVITAEESTAWPGVTAPTQNAGLGFGSKWNMGWMNDTLSFMRTDPDERPEHFKELTFPLMYAFSEEYTLPLSHDEVVHGKGSLWGKMPGDETEKAANLRLMLAHQFGHPGKKLLFMGAELGQIREWSHDRELDWDLLSEPLHAGIQTWVRSLNTLYRDHSALWNDSQSGFEWLDISDPKSGTASYLRKNGEYLLAFLLNFSKQKRTIAVGVPVEGSWMVELNSQSRVFDGSGDGPRGQIHAEQGNRNNYPAFLELVVPALTAIVCRPSP